MPSGALVRDKKETKLHPGFQWDEVLLRGTTQIPVLTGTHLCGCNGIHRRTISCPELPGSFKRSAPGIFTSHPLSAGTLRSTNPVQSIIYIKLFRGRLFPCRAEIIHQFMQIVKETVPMPHSCQPCQCRIAEAPMPGAMPVQRRRSLIPANKKKGPRFA